jgi:hypothetical protein
VRGPRATYDAAILAEENKEHWASADSLSARSANSPDVRQRLRDRSRYEASNNPYLRAVISSLANDTIGTGPRLQLSFPEYLDRERLIDARNQQQRAIEQAQQEQRLKWLKKQRAQASMTTAEVQGLEAAWQATYAELGHQAQFKVRLAESQAITIEQGRVVVAVLNHENQEWCEGRLKPRIAQALARHLAEEVTLTFIVFAGLGLVDEAREGL